MTECENPYRHFPQKSLPPEPVWKEGFEKGQENPDPKQYAKREELVEAFEKELKKELVPSRKHNQYAYGLAWGKEIIRTHGLEE